MGRSNDPARFLEPGEKEQAEAAIQAAEQQTSAEIKLMIVRHCWGSIEQKCTSLFARHGLHKTAERNCVMVLLATTNREFCIFGDEGIHAKVGQTFWDDVRDVMAAEFGEGRFGTGLAAGIERIGEKLAEHFPHRTDDVDEISNEVGYDE